MRFLLTTWGSRGDVEPMAALAVALKAQGAEAVVCAPPEKEFIELLDRAGVEFAPAFMRVRDWIALAGKPPMDLPRRATEMAFAQFGALKVAAEGCDLILGTGLMPSCIAAHTLAERTGARWAHVSFCPMLLPSEHHAPFVYPGQAPADGTADNRTLWAHNVEVMDALFGGAANDLRASVGLPPVDNVRDHVFGEHPLLASDPALWPWEPTDLCRPVQTGAWVLPDTRPLPEGLDAFLGAGTPPVYVGFGSMAMGASRDAAQAAISAARAHGRRVVLAGGWAGFSLPDEGADCFLVADVNQQALFPRVAAAIHHGGAGTTFAAARAGVPQIIAPQVVDQPFWAARIEALEAGVAHDGPTPTHDSLNAALATALSPVVATHAVTLASLVHIDGAARAAAALLGQDENRAPEPTR
ncbi:glycosyltransferase [Brevundimonas kwangchunensis]|uniref:Glycosyltransferase n=1 Tax=Brevundimonas kwangchunensis TaxID=322163 RepID=A0ABN1GSQ7_9CAUL